MSEIVPELELKPCPFCGGKAKLKSYESKELPLFILYWVTCSKCFVKTTSKLYSEVEAINKWNMRYGDT